MVVLLLLIILILILPETLPLFWGWVTAEITTVVVVPFQEEKKKKIRKPRAPRSKLSTKNDSGGFGTAVDDI